MSCGRKRYQKRNHLKCIAKILSLLPLPRPHERSVGVDTLKPPSRFHTHAHSACSNTRCSMQGHRESPTHSIPAPAIHGVYDHTQNILLHLAAPAAHHLHVHVGRAHGYRPPFHRHLPYPASYLTIAPAAAAAVPTTASLPRQHPRGRRTSATRQPGPLHGYGQLAQRRRQIDQQVVRHASFSARASRRSTPEAS